MLSEPFNFVLIHFPGASCKKGNVCPGNGKCDSDICVCAPGFAGKWVLNVLVTIIGNDVI